MPEAQSKVMEPEINVESKQLHDLAEQKDELIGKVQTLKKELQDWRAKLDSQVKSYRMEIGDLKRTLNTEVEALRTEFMDIKSTLKQQLELTAGLASQEIAETDKKLTGVASSKAL